MRNTVTQLWGTNSRMAALSTITGGGKWVEISVAADPLHQHLLLTAEKKFWRCVQFGDTPRRFGVEPPRPRIEASAQWLDFDHCTMGTHTPDVDIILREDGTK